MSPRLFLQVLSLEARTKMSYRVDFWLRTLFALVAELGAYVFLAFALFAEAGAGTVRGFDRGELVLYYVAIMLLGKLVAGADHANEVSQDIYGGGLTRYLLFPRAYVPFKYAQRLGAQVSTGIQAVLFGGVLLLWLDSGSSLRLTPGTLAMTALAVALGNLLYFLLRLSLEMVAFWQDNIWSLVVLLRNVSRLLGGAMIPLALFPERLQAVLWWLPFRLVFDVPARTLLGRIDAAEWWTSMALGLAWVLVTALVAHAVWRRGTLQYTGVGI